MSQARRLAQGKVIRIHVSSPFPVQIDGEPFIQQPGYLEITHHGQVYHFALINHTAKPLGQLYIKLKVATEESRSFTSLHRNNACLKTLTKKCNVITVYSCRSSW